MLLSYLKVVFLFSFLFLTACSTLTQDLEIETNKKNSIDYTNYKTFTWSEKGQIEFDLIGQWEQPTVETDTEVKRLIKKSLNERNLILGDENADLLVCFAAGINFSSLNLALHPDLADIQLKDIPQSSLLVAVIDAKTNQTIFLGYAKGEPLQQQSLENIYKRLNYAVAKIFKPFKRSWFNLPFLS